jgi:serine protease Do
MSRRPAAFAAALLISVAIAAPAAAQTATKKTIPDLVEQLLPGVVSIHATHTPGGNSGTPPSGSPFEEYFKRYFDRNPSQRRGNAMGSGFVIDQSGYIVTNHHVIASATRIRIVFSDGRSLNAKIVGKDRRADLALLKVESKTPLRAMSWGDSDQVRVGQDVIAIGNPFGLSKTVTKGIISARSRFLPNMGRISASAFVDFLQTDAAINKGNSGGPLFNLQGEVIGINTAIYSRVGTNVGIAFAVPSNLARPIIEQLRKYGRTRRGWLGVHIREVEPGVARTIGMKKPTGAIIVNVFPGSPAATAGLLVGDVILSFNGKAVPNSRKLPQIVAATDVGKTVDVVVWRKGKGRMTMKVRLGELEKATLSKKKGGQGATPDGEGAVLGMQLSKLTPKLKQQFQIAGDKGVVVVRVTRGSEAARKGIRPGDVLLELDLVKVKAPEDVRKLLAKSRKERKRSVLVLVERGRDRKFVPLDLPSN